MVTFGMRPQGKLGLRLCACFLASISLFAQNTIRTFAGARWTYPREILTATFAPLGSLSSLAFSPNGDLLVADVDNNIVVRISPAGTANVIAGNSLQGFVADGQPATSASLGSPAGVIADPKGNIYIADSGGGAYNPVNIAGIRKVAPDGNITTLGQGLYPTGPMAVDSGGTLYIVDGYSKVSRLQPDGTFLTVAGTGKLCFGCAPVPDGAPALSANFGNISGMAADQNGNLYLADSWALRIYKLSASGAVSTLKTEIEAGQIAFDTGGTLYFTENGSIRSISQSGIVTHARRERDPHFLGGRRARKRCRIC